MAAENSRATLKIRPVDKMEQSLALGIKKKHSENCFWIISAVIAALWNSSEGERQFPNQKHVLLCS
jgi:hypothetical protein